MKIETFLNENVKKAKKNVEIGPNFRIHHIHSLKIDELFKLNLDVLERFYDKEKRIPGYSFESMQNLLKIAGFYVYEDEFRSLCCYSKEIIIDENREGYYRLISN